jgi:histidyl-tRNA synthetase
MKFRSIKGTKDILPDESGTWQAVERTIRDVMHVFNYKEIRTPVFEETALFARGIGELTDIVGKEMYTFDDRGGTSLTLKPEMTASVIRAYIQHQLGEQQPLTKVYYIAPMFRQERPQAGRLRQFHQFGAEAIGGQQPAIDAEIVALCVEVYRQLEIDNVELRINSVGCETCRPVYKEKLKKFLRPRLDDLSEESKRRFDQNPLRILDSKDEDDRALTKGAPLLIDHLCEICGAHFNGVMRALKSLGIAFEIDGRIVRGLDYYTKTAFELIGKELGSQDALVGGGRYDLLVKELGGKQTPAVGFAAGIERLLMVLGKQKKRVGAVVRPTVFIVAADNSSRDHALREAAVLRRAGVSCEIDLLERSLKSQMREADRQRAENVIVLGEREIQSNEVAVKNMQTGEERRIALSQLIDFFTKPR